MRQTFDAKSLMVGTFAGAALIAGLGAVQNDEPKLGRYMIESSGAGTGSFRAFVLDTATGQVWESTSRGFHAPKLGAIE